jgi:hypothetical protein
MRRAQRAARYYSRLAERAQSVALAPQPRHAARRATRCTAQAAQHAAIRLARRRRTTWSGSKRKTKDPPGRMSRLHLP